MEALGRQLMHPDLLRQFISDFTREWNRLAAEAGQAQSTQRQALEAVERQIANLVDAIAEGLRAPGLQAKLDGLEAQRVTLTAELTKRPANPPALHPNLADVYRERVARLEQALADRDAPEALEAARALIDRVIVSPPSDPGSPPGIELVGQLQAMLCAGGADIGTKDRRSANAVLSLFDSAVKAGPGGQRPPRLCRQVARRAVGQHPHAQRQVFFLRVLAPMVADAADGRDEEHRRWHHPRQVLRVMPRAARHVLPGAGGE
jgi:hypothetical protein